MTTEILTYFLIGWLFGLIFIDINLSIKDFKSHLFEIILYWSVYLIFLIIKLIFDYQINKYEN